MLKHIQHLILAMCLFASFAATAQNNLVVINTDSLSKRVVKKASGFSVVKNLGVIEEIPLVLKKKYRTVPNKLRRNKYKNTNALPKNSDPLLKNKRVNKSNGQLNMINSWAGMNEAMQQVMPPDPSGAIGRNHYIQMVNTAMQIFDKEGNSLWGPTSLSSVFPGSDDDGDPIVLYDRYADRWFISQFQKNNTILIGISQTSDPLANWYYYTFQLDDFPDYPKFSVWNDGYYMTANMLIQNAVSFERDKMIAGDPNARMVALTIPNLEENGFFSALPANACGVKMPEGPISLFYFQDDGWANGNDRINIWEMNVDWAFPMSSSIVLKQEIPVAPFNTDFDPNWNDLPQPNTSQKIDAVPGAFMFMANQRSFTNYDAITLCHTVDVDLSVNMNSAIRWYELRKAGSNWSLEQQGTFAPDDENRFMGSIGMDRQGNIGIAYSLTSNNTFPSLKFTGRRATDDTGTMSFDETSAFEGTGSQTNSTRFGDYAQLTIDPVDDLTFWYTGEFIGNNGWETGIFSFKIGENFATDIGIDDVRITEDTLNPNIQTITFTARNLGTDTIYNFFAAYAINPSNTSTQGFSGTLAPNDTASFTFAEKASISIPGEYTVAVNLIIDGDEDEENNTLTVNYLSKYDHDIALLQITNPLSGQSLGNESVNVKVINTGTQQLDTIPLAFMINGAIVRDTFITSLPTNTEALFEFTETYDFSTIQSHTIKIFAELVKDENPTNDTILKTIEHFNCNPTSDCFFGDNIIYFQIGSKVHNSTCEFEGYGNFTDEIFEVGVGATEKIIIEVEETSHQLSVWIDFNNNLVFEINERILTNYFYSNRGEIQLTIPNNATVGQHLMRVRSRWEGPSDAPCTAYDYGETHDYTVNVIDPNNMYEIEGQNKYNVYVANGTAFVTSNLTSNFETSVELLNGLGQVIATEIVPPSQNINTTINVRNLAKGVYYIKINENNNTQVVPVLVTK